MLRFQRKYLLSLEMNSSLAGVDPVDAEEVLGPGAGGYLVVLAVHQLVGGVNTENTMVMVYFAIYYNQLTAIYPHT